MAKYTTVAVKEDGIWGVTCPSLPGVFGVGDTQSRAESDFIASLNTLIDYLHEIHEELPRPKVVKLGSLTV